MTGIEPEDVLEDPRDEEYGRPHDEEPPDDPDVVGWISWTTR